MTTRFAASTRFAGWAAVVGGTAWGVTPLRDVIYGSPVTAGSTTYAVYEGIVALVGVLLAVGLRTVAGTCRTGALVVLAGYLLLIASAFPAAGDLDRTLADVGFFGALVAAVGAIPLGAALWRRGARTPGSLLVLTLPVGLPLVVAISAAGAVNVAGLAMTLPYGAAWVLLGSGALQREPTLTRSGS